MEDPSNRIFVSQISLMELAIKKSLNKLPNFVPDIKAVVDQLFTNGFELLQLTNEQIAAYQELSLFQEHRDPFDRFLIAIAEHENFVIMTTDAKFRLYSSIIALI